MSPRSAVIIVLALVLLGAWIGGSVTSATSTLSNPRSISVQVTPQQIDSEASSFIVANGYTFRATVTHDGRYSVITFDPVDNGVGVPLIKRAQVAANNRQYPNLLTQLVYRDGVPIRTHLVFDVRFEQTPSLLITVSKLYQFE